VDVDKMELVQDHVHWQTLIITLTELVKRSSFQRF